ncbi:hypothetical protein DV701_04150 [Ornithinimicrobium avium]|uniref:Uncharacterized protein n=1 Tax=Ornithinimicrobium avium TaxID=2283195 RepID=A0A345NK69_9MICO|nr:hypothetical protein DV701_04150 [Ornithinimicrobium avium]
MRRLKTAPLRRGQLLTGTWCSFGRLVTSPAWIGTVLLVCLALTLVSSHIPDLSEGRLSVLGSPPLGWFWTTAIAAAATPQFLFLVAGLHALRHTLKGDLRTAVIRGCSTHMACRLGVPAVASVVLRDERSGGVFVEDLCAFPRSHRAGSALGSAMVAELDRRSSIARATCRPAMVPLYTDFGFRCTGWTRSTSSPVRPLVIMERDPGGP